MDIRTAASLLDFCNDVRIFASEIKLPHSQSLDVSVCRRVRDGLERLLKQKRGQQSSVRACALTQQHVQRGEEERRSQTHSNPTSHHHHRST